MLFDCDTLGVVLKKGDVLPGPVRLRVRHRVRLRVRLRVGP